MAEVRRISRDLRPVVLDELGLAAALRHQAEVLEAAGGLAIHVVLPVRLPVMPEAVEVAVVRIAGEALTNVVRHASAAHCVVRLDVGRVVRLEVRRQRRRSGDHGARRWCPVDARTCGGVRGTLRRRGGAGWRDAG